MVSASSGASQLYNGSKTLVNGLTTANAGVTKLQNGSTALSKGAKQLHAATTTLAEKTGELNKGMQTFKMDGIDKMKQDVYKRQTLMATSALNKGTMLAEEAIAS